MKKTTMILLVAAAIILASCVKAGRASSVFSIGTTFEMSESDLEQYMVDSLMYAPEFSWENVTIFKSKSASINQGYEGGFILSMKKGNPYEPDNLTMLSSADPGAGAEGSSCYMAFNQTYSMPPYDIEYDFSSYYTAESSIVGFYLCNSLYNSMLADEGKIYEGDYLRLTVEFFKGGNLVGSVQKYLIDYYTTRQLSMVNKWEAWDVQKEIRDSGATSIGSFDAVRFRLEASGSQIKPCFCLDNFIVQLSVEY